MHTSNLMAPECGRDYLPHLMVVGKGVRALSGIWQRITCERRYRS